MRRLIIAVDCDDVLVPTASFFVDLYNKTYGTSGTLAQSHNPDPSIWQVGGQLLSERWFAMTKDEEYKKLAPIPEEIEILRRLAEVHELHLVTARREEERSFTRSMLDNHLSGVFRSMEFVGWEGSKGEVCKSIQADVIIDDAFRHLESAHQHGVEGLLWFGDYPWQIESHDDMPVIRCGGWSDVEAEIERIAAN